MTNSPPAIPFIDGCDLLFLSLLMVGVTRLFLGLIILRYSFDSDTCLYELNTTGYEGYY